jgi:hypothetical protein
MRIQIFPSGPSKLIQTGLDFVKNAGFPGECLPCCAIGERNAIASRLPPEVLGITDPALESIGKFPHLQRCPDPAAILWRSQTDVAVLAVFFACAQLLLSFNNFR